jgi:ABC-type multidrug transport system ATPase subunit
MAGLDPDGRAMLWEELRGRVSRGAAVCLASHDLGDVEQHADTVWIMDGGKLIATGSPRELIAEYGQCAITATFASAVSAAAVDEALANTDGVINVAVQGERVVVRLDDVMSHQEPVLAALAKVAGKLVSVDLQRPSLAGVLRATTGVVMDQGQGRDPGQGGGGGGGRGMGRGLNRRGR